MKRLPLLLALAVFPLVPLSQARIDARLGAYRAQEEVLYLWTGEHVKRLFPGCEALAADIYWLRTVQYFGGERLYSRQKRFELLRPLIDIATTLDPRLEVAYRYGAIFLSEPAPVGAGRPREGIAILEKGVAQLPNAWRLRQDLGFFHHIFLGDTPRAAAILNEAARVPGAAFWLRTLAADLLMKGGSRADARRMWQQMYDQEETGIIRDNARQRLKMIDSLDLADAIAVAGRAFARRHGRLPGSLEELRAGGLWRGPLVDVSGTPFSYDASTGQVALARESPLWRPN